MLGSSDSLGKIDEHFTFRGEAYTIDRTQLGIYIFKSKEINETGNNIMGLLDYIVTKYKMY